MRTIITIDSRHTAPGSGRFLRTTVHTMGNKPPNACFVEITDAEQPGGDGDTVQESIEVDPKELIELGEIISRLYK